MKKSIVLSLAVTLLLSLACGSGIELNHDYDQQLDFSQFKTFQWVPSKSKDPGSQSAQQAQQTSGLIEERIKNAVINELTKKGMRSVTSDPDVYVVYHLGTQDKVDIADYGYDYGYGRYGGVYGGPYGAGGGGISTYNYTEGTLIIDMFDAVNKQLAWRGSGTGVLDENPSPEQLTKGINEAVAAILSQYPPKK
jgi:hypothetical protein